MLWLSIRKNQDQDHQNNAENKMLITIDNVSRVFHMPGVITTLLHLRVIKCYLMDEENNSQNS